MDFIDIVSKIGDGTSWITSKINLFASNLFKIELTIWQDKLITILLIGFLILLLLTLLKSIRRIVKWGIVAVFITLILSVLVSIFK